MILDGKGLIFSPFFDSRGESGMSGKLRIAEAKDGTKYLVKSAPVDATNEFVTHRLARLIGVPTSDAVLIKSGSRVSVGIVFEPDFKRVPWNDFLGTVEYKEDDPILINGKVYETPLPAVPKYSDDDPLLSEFMAYLAFRDLIVLEDNAQLAFAEGHLISFDYAESFYLTEYTFNNLLRGSGLSHAVGLFANHQFLENGYRDAIQFLHRPNTDFLLDAYLDPVFAFQEADFQPIFDDLDAVFPPLVSAFYAACFAFTRKQIEKLGE